MREFLRRHGAAFIFFALLAIAAVTLLLRGSSGHFDIFRRSAQLLWQAENPYAILYPSAYYFYSPFCGLFFFGLFAQSIYWLDLLAYTLLSAFVLWRGMLSWKPLLNPRLSFTLLVFIASMELNGSILNAKLEIFLLGALLLLSKKAFFEKRLWAWALIGVLCNWKFIMLPSAGLLLLMSFLEKKEFKSGLSLLLGLGFAFASPALLLGWKPLLQMHESWSSSLEAFMVGGQNNWLGFEHLFNSLRSFSGFAISLGQAKVVILVSALLLSLWGGFVFYKKNLDKKSCFLWAMSSGAAFSVCLGPLSQSAAFIMALPLVYAYMEGGTGLTGNWKKLWLIVGLVSFMMVCVVYSDLNPRYLKEIIRPWAPKALGIALAWLCLQLFVAKQDRSHDV